MIKEGEIYKYFRVLNGITPKGSLIADTFGNIDVFICVTENSYYIFDLKKFDILFIGPFIPSLETYYFYANILYITTGNLIKKYQRACCVGEIVLEKKVKQLLCVGDLLFVLDISGECVIIEGDSRVSISKQNIELIHHPHAYLNKILLVFKDFSILFNFRKLKEVYKFTSLKGGICLIEDSQVIDVVGVGYSNGTIDIVDLKKDSVLFSFDVKSKPKEITFGQDKLTVIADDKLFIFNLETKRLILKRNGIFSCKVVGDNLFLLYSSSSIGIFQLKKDVLEKIKSKDSLTEDIIGIDCCEVNEFLIYSTNKVFKYNTGNTFNYQKLKFNGKIEKSSLKDGMGAVYGDRILYKVDTSIKHVLTEEVSVFSTYKNTCTLITQDLVLLNLDSLRTYATIKSDRKVKAIEMDRENLYLLSEDRLAIVPYRGKSMPCTLSEIFSINSYEVGGFHNIKLFDNILVLQSPSLISLFVNGRVFRTFNVPNVKDFSISSNLKWIALATETLVFVFDILSGNKIEELDCACKLVRFSQDMLFLIVVTQKDEIILLNNKLEFNPKEVVPDKITMKGPVKEGFLKTNKKNLVL